MPTPGAVVAAERAMLEWARHLHRHAVGPAWVDLTAITHPTIHAAAGADYAGAWCPSCGTNVDDWFWGAVGEAVGGGSLHRTPPCCATPRSLADFAFPLHLAPSSAPDPHYAAAGVARFWLQVDVSGIEFERWPRALGLFEDLLETPLRAVHWSL